MVVSLGESVLRLRGFCQCICGKIQCFSAADYRLHHVIYLLALLEAGNYFYCRLLEELESTNLRVTYKQIPDSSSAFLSLSME
jgi:hypothetical protein